MIPVRQFNHQTMNSIRYREFIIKYSYLGKEQKKCASQLQTLTFPPKQPPGRGLYLKFFPGGLGFVHPLKFPGNQNVGGGEGDVGACN